MQFENSVRDWRGRVTGYRCFECGAIRQSMWGNICNECRDKERRHRELIAAIRQRSTANLNHGDTNERAKE